MPLPKTKQSTEILIKRAFVILLILANCISICNYIVWKDVEKITSLFYRQDSREEGLVAGAIMDIETVSALTVLGLVIVGIGLSIWKRKYFWYLLAALLTFFFIDYLDTKAYYLPN